MDEEKIGKFIAELRKERNMTQQELANLILSTREAVSKWERGKCYPSYQILIKISEIFNVSLDELLYGEKKNTNNTKEISKFVGKIYDDRNKKHRKILILYGTILILLILFLIYYFITTFNSLKIYNIYCLRNDLSISDGIFVITNKNIYINFLQL